MGKGENAGYQHFLLFPHCFPIFQRLLVLFQSFDWHFLLCKNSFNLDKILLIWTSLKILKWSKEIYKFYGRVKVWFISMWNCLDYGIHATQVWWHLAGKILCPWDRHRKKGCNECLKVGWCDCVWGRKFFLGWVSFLLCFQWLIWLIQ